MRTRKPLSLALVAAMMIAMDASAGQTCKDSAGACTASSTLCVCVDRADLSDPPPVEGTDFALDFTDSSNPDVTFKTGHSTNAWKVWSMRSATDDSPRALGDIFIDSTSSTDNYLIEIRNPDNGSVAGCTTLGSAVLDDTTSWTGYSSITNGSISGDLKGDITLVESSGSGGELTLTIEGSVASGTLAEPDISMPVVKDLTIDGDLNGDIVISEEIDGTLEVKDSVLSGGSIRITDMVNDSEAIFGDPGEDDTFYGDIILINGLAAGEQISIHGPTASTASIDLTTDDLAGTFFFTGGDGDILNGGDVVSGGKWFEYGDDFGGSATFASVASGGQISMKTQSDLSGTITVEGNVAGSITVTGDMLQNSRIDIEGGFQSTGLVDAQGFVNGTIQVDGDADGDIDILEDLRANGRVLVDGALGGDVTITEGTNLTSQITFTGGMESAGSLVINDGQGDHDADGDILVGVTKAPLPTDPTPNVVPQFMLVLRRSDHQPAGGA